MPHNQEAVGSNPTGAGLISSLSILISVIQVSYKGTALLTLLKRPSAVQFQAKKAYYTQNWKTLVRTPFRAICTELFTRYRGFTSVQETVIL